MQVRHGRMSVVMRAEVAWVGVVVVAWVAVEGAAPSAWAAEASAFLPQPSPESCGGKQRAGIPADP